MTDNRIRIIIEGVDQASGPIGNISRSLGQMGTIAAGIGIAAGLGALTQGVIGAGQAALQSYASFERLSMSLNALTAKEAVSTGQAANMQQALAQTSGKAKELLGWIQQLAIKSPFSQNDVSQAFRLSLAYGFTTNEAQRMTKAMLDFAAGSGATGDAMGRIGLALGQIRARGKLGAEELNQLAEAGMDVRGELAKAMGMSVAEVSKLVEKGLIPANEAIATIVKSMEDGFGGSAERMGETIGGLLESLGDIQDMTGRNLFGGMFEAAQPYVADLTTVLSSPEFQAKITEFGNILGGGLASGLLEVTTALDKAKTALGELPDEAPEWLKIVTGLAPFTDKKANVSVTANPTGETAINLFDAQGVGGQLTLDADMKIKVIEWNFGEGFEYKDGGILYKGTPILIEFVTELLDIQKQLTDWANSLAPSFGMGEIKNLLDLEMALTNWADGISLDFVANLIPDFGAIPDWIRQQMGGGYNNDYSPYNPQMNLPIPSGMSDPWNTPGNASGTDAWRGGWTWVGEQGPELVNLPAGSQVLSNPASKALMRTGLAGGTFGPPTQPGVPTFSTPLGGSLWSLLGLGGGKSSPFGGFDEFTKAAESTSDAFGNAADKTGDAFADAAKKQAQAFESAIGKVPGLFGTSQVTAGDMAKAKAGMSVNYADDYRRQLNDEVLNGKDWAGVDIKDAAARLNIDPNLPQEIILEAFNAAWADSSLFANKDNLDLINTDAVKAGLEQQQQQLQGQVNLASLFGIDDKAKAEQSELLGAQIATVFGDAATPELMQPMGTKMAVSMAGGFADATAAATAVNSMSGALSSALGIAANQTAIINAGRTLADLEYAGYSARMGELPPKPPSGGNPPTIPPENPPGKALGGYATGWTVVGEYGPELVNFGRNGAYVYSSSDSQSMGGGGVTNVYQNFSVNSELLAEMAARKAVALIRQRGR